MTAQDYLEPWFNRIVNKAEAAIDEQLPGQAEEFRDRVEFLFSGTKKTVNAIIQVRNLARTLYGVDVPWG